MPQTTTAPAHEAQDIRFRIEELTGEFPIFPGHPLVLGFAIMNAFPDLQAALKVDQGATCPSALTSSEVPGGRGEVYRALDLLQDLASRKVALADALDKSNADWRQGCESGFAQRVAPGVQQAAALEGEFVKLATTWFAATGSSHVAA